MKRLRGEAGQRGRGEVWLFYVVCDVEQVSEDRGDMVSGTGLCEQTGCKDLDI